MRNLLLPLCGPLEQRRACCAPTPPALLPPLGYRHCLNQSNLFPSMQPDINARIRKVMDGVGLPRSDKFVVRMTGEWRLSC